MTTTAQTEADLSIRKSKIPKKDDEPKTRPSFDMMPDKVKITQRIKSIEERRDAITREKKNEIELAHVRYNMEDELLRKEKYFLSSLLE